VSYDIDKDGDTTPDNYGSLSGKGATGVRQGDQASPNHLREREGLEGGAGGGPALRSLGSRTGPMEASSVFPPKTVRPCL